MPRPGTPLIHPDWLTLHAVTLAATWTATGTITRNGGETGTFDPATGVTAQPGRTTVYSGPLRVQQLETRSTDIEFGGQQVTLAQARIGMPLTVLPAVDDRITITACTDPQMVGLTYRVRQVAQSSITWQRDVVAEVDRG